MTSPEGSASSGQESSFLRTCPACSLPRDSGLIAYAAGILDGEGSLVISSMTTRGRTRYWPLLVVQMAKPQALNVMFATFGGRLGAVSSRPQENRAAMLRWEMSGSGIRCPLMHMTPFLTVKKKQAALILEMLGRDWPLSANKRGIRWDAEVSAEWEVAKREIGELNRRGTSAIPGALAQRVGDQWMVPIADALGERWEMFSGPFPRSGSMRSGVLFEHPMPGPVTSVSGLSSLPGRSVLEAIMQKLLPASALADSQGARN